MLRLPLASLPLAGLLLARLPLASLPLAGLLLLTACTAGRPAPVAAPAPAPTGTLDSGRLEALLLQPADLPGLAGRRSYASATLTTQTSPQLDLCRPTVPAAPHELANVIVSAPKVGQVKVFEVVSAYGDSLPAQHAYDDAVARARACPSFPAAGRAYSVTDLEPVAVPPPAAAVHYRLSTPDVVGGDVRTLARSGRFTVLVSGFGAPPNGMPLLDYQADVLRAALRRLPSS